MRKILNRTLGSTMVVTVAALFSGCAGAPPSGRMESSAATIRAAQEVGATKTPDAALHLQLAEEQAEHARKLLEEGGDEERDQAEMLLMRAQSDADLALALAREDADRTAAQQAVENVHSLQPAK